VRLFNEPQLSGCVRIAIPYQIDKLITILAEVFEPELICFDMDGVLIDTSESYDKAIKATVKEFTGKMISDEDINQLRSLGGFNNDWVLAKALIEQQGQNIELQKVIDCFQQYYLGSEEQPGFIANETLLANEGLERALNKQSADIAIVTGRPRAEAILGTENVAKKLAVFKTARVISDDDVTESKPSPMGIHQLKQKLNCQRSWMVGDTPDDMMAARGSNSVAVGIGSRNQQALVKAGADIVVDSVNQLENLL
jgi:histidinol-phosphate aminotransferase